MIQAPSIERNPETAAKAPDAGYSAIDLLIVLARRKFFILKCAFFTAALAALVAFILPNQYTAETVVLPPSQTPSATTALLNQIGGGALASIAGANLGIKNPGDLYVSLLRSRTVEDAVISRFGLMSRYRDKRMSDARKDFEERASVVLGAKDGLIRIAVRDRDPKLASDIANGYVEELRKLCATIAVSEASQRRLFFQQQLQEAKNNLALAEVEMKNTQQSTGVLQIDSQARALIESAATLRAQIVAKQVQLQAMRSFATEENPELTTVKQQLSALQAQLAKLGGGDENSGSDLMVPKGKIPQAGMEYIRKYREVKYYETIYELIAKQFELAKLDEARQGAVIQVADVALPPDRKSSPKRGLITLLALLVGFALSIFWAVTSAGMANARHNPDQYNKIQTLRGLVRSSSDIH